MPVNSKPKNAIDWVITLEDKMDRQIKKKLIFKHKIFYVGYFSFESTEITLIKSDPHDN